MFNSALECSVDTMPVCWCVVWKEEDRCVIPKCGKDDYHKCEAYTTISITSCLGKHFEHITFQRLITLLEEKGFDPLQFAYLKSKHNSSSVTVSIRREGQEETYWGNQVNLSKNIMTLAFRIADCFSTMRYRAKRWQWQLQTGTSDTPLCECGRECETVDHFLFRCCNHELTRKAMYDSIYEIWTSNYHKGHWKLSENFLLSAAHDSSVTKKMDKEIKYALLQFFLYCQMEDLISTT